MYMASEEKTTIHDIANKAGVSISTVSRVLNDNKAVRASSRQAVLDAVKELNYQPNIFASGLAGGKSKTIGIITQYVANPFFDYILRGIMEEMLETDYQPLFADGRWQEDKERQSVQAFLERKIDGLIILGGVLPVKELIAIEKRIPLLVIGRDIEELGDSCIPLENFDGAYKATQHLIQNGHRRIVHVTGIMRHEDAVERLAGYKHAMQEAGLAADDRFIVEGDFSEQSGVMAAEKLLTSGPTFTAVFAANDQMAMGFRLALYRHAIRVPEDVSIIGFDNQPATAFLTPPLTTIGQPALEIGHSVAKRIVARILDQPEEIDYFEANLIVRNSVSRIF